MATKPVAPAAALSPEGRWRSSMPRVGVMTVKLLPDGTLDMMDAHQRHHRFPRIGPDRWEARLSRQVVGSIQREGDQLVFRTRPTPEANKPIGQKNGLMIAVQPKSIEDHMTRVPDTSPVKYPGQPD